MPRPTNGRAKFYHRDSDRKSERAPSQYVKWACQQSQSLGLKFDGTPETIDRMIKQGQTTCGDLYLDYGFRGKNWDRPALNALVAEIHANQEISHLLIPRRDRLSRPQDPITAVEFEQKVRRLGVTIVYQNRILKPLRFNERADVLETTKALHDFDESGRFSHALADKLIQAKFACIEICASIGGTPPYGFERWLVGPGGQPVRKVMTHERVKLREHYICWLPTNVAEINVVIRIMELCKTMSCTAIAEKLTIEGVAPPYSWRLGSSGVWNRQSVRNIVKNSIYAGTIEYGKMCGGEFLRMTPDGVRELDESDLDNDQNPKQIINPVERRIRKTHPKPPVIELKTHLEAVAAVQERRGKPRQQGARFNPLGCRVYDRSCGWGMYRKARDEKFSYTCSAYMQSDGDLCNHNSVDGIKAASFVAKVIRQTLLIPDRLDLLKARIMQLAKEEKGHEASAHNLKQQHSKVLQLEKQVKNAARNLAIAESPEESHELRSVFNQLKSEQKLAEDQLKSMEAASRLPSSLDQEVDIALKGVDRLRALLASTDQQSSCIELFKMVNAFLYVGFTSTKKGGKKANLVNGGIVTLGSSTPPVQIYHGPTEKGIVKDILRSPLKNPA